MTSQHLTSEQQAQLQRHMALQAAVQADGFFLSGHPFPWCPPGPEFWQGVLASRKAKRKLEKRHEGPPNKKAPREEWVVREVVDKRTGEVRSELVPPPAYKYVSADDYVEELDRATLDNQIVVLPSSTVEDTSGGGRKLAASYYVAHAATGQGLVLRCDVPVSGGGGMGDPTKKAYTDSLAMFCRGFLAIPRTDEPYHEEDPQPGSRAQPAAQAPETFSARPPMGPVPGVSVMVPMAPPPGAAPMGPPPGFAPMGPPPGFAPMGPPPAFHGQQSGPGFAGGQGGIPASAPGPYGPPQAGNGYAPGGGHGGPPRSAPPHAAQPFQAPPPPPVNGGLLDHPIVHEAQRQLEAQYVGPRVPPPDQHGFVPGYGQTYGGQHQPAPQQQPEPEPDLSSIPEPAQPEPLRGSRPGEPQTMDDWVEALVERGWDEETAIMLAGHKPDEPISVPLRDEIVRTARPHFASSEALRDAFAGTGFVPQPGLPNDVRPRPTGLQTLRFCLKIDRNNHAAATA